jgi:hypothetical protein
MDTGMKRPRRVGLWLFQHGPFLLVPVLFWIYRAPLRGVVEMLLSIVPAALEVAVMAVLFPSEPVKENRQKPYWLDLRRLRQKKDSPRIDAAPGHTLLAVARWLYPVRTVEEVIEPSVADLRFEYNEALAAGRRGQAKWIRLRGTWSILEAAGLSIFVRFVLKAWKMIR